MIKISSHTKIALPEITPQARLFLVFRKNYDAERNAEIKPEKMREHRGRESNSKISVKDTPTQLELLDLTLQLIVGGN